jgi:hypothetical protein
MLQHRPPPGLSVSVSEDKRINFQNCIINIYLNLAVKFNLLKNTQPHYSYTPKSCLENDSYKLYFDRTILTDIHIKHNRPDIIILNKQQKQAYLLDIAVPNSRNITQTYNTKINKYLELSVAMRNLWCLEKISILPFVVDLPTLQHRRRRGDLIWTYKILTNNESDELLNLFEFNTNKFKILRQVSEAISFRIEFLATGMP